MTKRERYAKRAEEAEAEAEKATDAIFREAWKRIAREWRGLEADVHKDRDNSEA